MRAVKSHMAAPVLFAGNRATKALKSNQVTTALATSAKGLSCAIYSKSAGFSRDSALAAFANVKAKKR